MKIKLQSLAVALAATLAAGAASAQNNVVKFGVTEYTTHSRTNGVSGIGVPGRSWSRMGARRATFTTR